MSGNTKRRAQESAERCIPLGVVNRPEKVSAFIAGYMAGHAAHTRSASKRSNEFQDIAIKELKAVEREIGVPSKALTMVYQSSFRDSPGRNHG